MHKVNRFLVFGCITVLVFVTGCGQKTEPAQAPPPPLPTVDVNATVSAAIAATSAAQSAVQATVGSAVQATVGVAVQATVAAIPSPTPYPTATQVDATSMTEEEFSALIDQSVQEAVAATESASSASTQAASDGQMTAEEVAAVEAYYYGAELAIEEATALADEYMSLYYDLAEETLALLVEVESDLSALAEYTASALATLDQMDQALAQGYQVAQEQINLLETQVQAAATNLEDIQTKSTAWTEDVKTKVEEMGNRFGEMQPNQIATDRRGALDMTRQYIDQVKGLLGGGGKISLSDLTNIAQLGSNASASLKNFGPELSKFGDSINGVTRNIARGELPQARSGLNGLDINVPRR